MNGQNITFNKQTSVYSNPSIRSIHVYSQQPKTNDSTTRTQKCLKFHWPYRKLQSTQCNVQKHVSSTHFPNWKNMFAFAKSFLKKWFAPPKKLCFKTDQDFFGTQKYIQNMSTAVYYQNMYLPPKKIIAKIKEFSTLKKTKGRSISKNKAHVWNLKEHSSMFPIQRYEPTK